MAASPALVYNDAPGNLPASYRLPPGFDMTLHSVSAQFDGTSASGDFYPCLAVYSQDNRLIGRFFPAQVLSSGDSAEVTFAPFLRTQAASSGGSGWQFNIDNEGGWGFVRSNASSDEGYGELGLLFADATGEGLKLVGQNAGNTRQAILYTSGDLAYLAMDASAFQIDPDNALLQALLDTGWEFQVKDSSGNVFISATDGNSLHLKAPDTVFIEDTDGNTGMRVFQDTGFPQVAFFSGAGGYQQPTPVTLGDVIAVLQTFGLVA